VQNYLRGQKVPSVNLPKVLQDSMGLEPYYGAWFCFLHSNKSNIALKCPLPQCAASRDAGKPGERE